MGGGNTINNLTISKDGNNGFFGQLGGTVMNLGLESGEIHGACIGGISSHSANKNAVIINCYSKVELYGTRTGCIADNFNGTILNCWSDCALHGEVTGNIYSYGALHKDFNVSGDSITAEQMNRTIAASASDAGIKYSDLNKWIDNASTLTFSYEKRNFMLSDIWLIAKANFNKVFLALIAAAEIITFILVTRKPQKRCQHSKRFKSKRYTLT